MVQIILAILIMYKTLMTTAIFLKVYSFYNNDNEVKFSI